MRCAFAILLLGLMCLIARGQTAPPAARPQPIAWRERVFFIPFHVRPAGNPQETPTPVRLFVSAARGRTWASASSADPRMRSFVFKAPGDGEYWFSIRTLDRQGRLLPTGPHRAGLSVLVDTELPQLQLSSIQGSAGEVQIAWQATDSNLDPASLQISVRCGPNGTWQPLAIGRPPLNSDPRTRSGRAAWVPPVGCTTVLVRSEVRDRAGNPAVRQSTVAIGPDASASGNAVATVPPAMVPDRSPPADPVGGQIGDVTQPTRGGPQLNASGQQPWPADRTSDVPFGGRIDGPSSQETGPRGVPYRQAATSRARAGQDGAPEAAAPPPTGPRWTPVSQQRTTPDQSPWPDRQSRPAESRGGGSGPAVGMRPMLVATQTFDLEYDIAPVDSSGIAKVELWGTRDAGQTWTNYGRDVDCRSPIRVEVDGEGVLGFRIVVQSGSGRGGTPPVAGDRPEIWVGVDLTPPTARILSARQSAVRGSGQLEIDWQAYDENLPPRPISLHYGSHPGGPWSMIVAGLKNTGHYTWTTDRHVPEQVYLRLDVRDAAGNATTVRTSRPVTLTRPQPTGRIRSVRPIDRAAAR
jgi:hypothetical protein